MKGHNNNGGGGYGHWSDDLSEDDVLTLSPVLLRMVAAGMSVDDVVRIIEAGVSADDVARSCVGAVPPARVE